MTSLWNSAVEQCAILSNLHARMQEIILSRLRPVKKGGVVDVLRIQNYFGTGARLFIYHTRYYTTIAFTNISEQDIVRCSIPTGDHTRAVHLMVTDLQLPITTREHDAIWFASNMKILQSDTLRPYMELVGRESSGQIQEGQQVAYHCSFSSNNKFEHLQPNEVTRLLDQTLSTLLKHGWYLNCRGHYRRTIMSPRGKINSLTKMAGYQINRHGTYKQNKEMRKTLNPSSSSSSDSSDSESE
jgi:hypothetical protein